MYIYLSTCTYVCMFVCMYICMYVCICKVIVCVRHELCVGVSTCLCQTPEERSHLSSFDVDFDWYLSIMHTDCSTRPKSLGLGATLNKATHMATVGLVSNLPHPRVNKTQQNTHAHTRFLVQRILQNRKLIASPDV